MGSRRAVLTDGRWIVRVRDASATPKITLICLAYAGGGPDIFRSWPGGLSTNIELLAICLPGHGIRMGEKPYEDWVSLVDAAFAAISPYLSSPHVFYGHSFGARLAYELAHRADTAFPGLTRRLLLSGCRAPSWSQARPFMHKLSDAALLEALRDMGGTPSEVLDNPRLMDLLLPVVRAEIRLAEIWGDEHGVGVSVPITAIYGREDGTDTREAVRSWLKFGCAGVEFVEMPGGHFFLHAHCDALLAAVDARLREGVDETSGK